MPKKLKIAQMSPLYEAVPPRLYGGTELVVADLCDALVELGHDVTLFASGDARTKAKLIPMRDQAIRLDPAPLKSDMASHLSMLHKVRSMADEFDILHFHIDLMHFPFFADIAHRTITTLHGRLDIVDLPAAYKSWPEFPIVSISDNQRLPLPEANWVRTVHHGMASHHYQLAQKPTGDYLAFLGRISPEKGPGRAVEIAKRAGMKLKVAAKVDAADKRYYEEEIEPLFGSEHVEFIGEINRVNKNEFLANARALLFPIDWPEPFGLVMIEAMGCGTPVIAWRNGSVPEVIEDGVTGKIVSSLDEAVAAVETVGSLDRTKIRERFIDRFSAISMAQRYLDLYYQQIG